MKVLKIVFQVIGHALLRIINTSFVTETVPSSWKMAEVTPLHKRDDASTASNFRPITKVPVVCKLVEKLVHDQVSSYMKEQHIFSDDQHGFRAKHSTCTALLTVSDQILKGMDRSEVSLVTLIDLSRCFDVIDHQMLLEKLQLLQISTGWFRSYLSGHTQKVRIGEQVSHSRPISIGTFQGTCLGPLLFNIATNDLNSYIPKEIDGFRITTVRYADDSQIIITGPRKKLSEMQRALEKVLDIANTWFLQNGMMVNASKTELLLCGDRRQLAQISEPPEINFKGGRLVSTDQVKNLGVVMDSTLSWNQHIRMLTNRCFGLLVGLSHAKHVLPVRLLPRLIDSIVLSQLRYCVQVYGSGNSENLGLIQKVLNFAARIISNRRKYDHISDVYLDLGWLNARQFVEYFDLCMLHSIMSTAQPDLLASEFKFNRDVCERSTRQSNQLNISRPFTNHGKRTFVYRASALFNKLTEHANTSDGPICTMSSPRGSFKRWAKSVVQL